MKVKTIFNEEIDTPCADCVVMDNTKFREGRIYQSKLWDLIQDSEIAYPGMVVLSPIRHVSNHMDLTGNEIKEPNVLMAHCKKAIPQIFDREKIACMFYEKPNGHIHFVVIPLHGLVKVKNKHSVLGKLMARAKELRGNKENIVKVINAINQFRNYFKSM